MKKIEILMTDADAKVLLKMLSRAEENGKLKDGFSVRTEDQ